MIDRRSSIVAFAERALAGAGCPTRPLPGPRRSVTVASAATGITVQVMEPRDAVAAVAA